MLYVAIKLDHADYAKKQECKNRECNEGNAGNKGNFTFQEMLSNIPGKVNKNSGECRKIFQWISSKIPRNVAKNSGECRQTFLGISSKISGNIFKHSVKCLQIFPGMSTNIPGNVTKYFRDFHQTLRWKSLLLKEMKMQGQSKISSCYFCVWCKSRELEGRGSLKFPCVIPNLESVSSDLLRAIISYWEESHLDSGQTSTMERFCKNSQRL